jgi:P-type Cu+ transporter
VHPARPQVPSIPCPVCGNPVDPLRAREVILLEDGPRYLCDAHCRDRFRAGDRIRTGRARRTPRANPPATLPVRSHATAPGSPSAGRTSTQAKATSAGAAARPRADADQALEPWQWGALGLVTVALLLGAIPAALPFDVISALASCGAATLALHASRHLREEVGWLPWLLGPVGVLLAAGAALGARVEMPQAWGGLAGAALAAGAVVTRVWLDRRSSEPVAQTVARLCAPIPTTVAVPVDAPQGALDGAVQRIPTAQVRTGEQVLALEGEVVAVDGVVQAGDAFALLHPSAQATVRRRPGDPLLAGARIVEGDVRLLATRVGEDRGLVRPILFRQGGGPTREPAPLGRLAAQLVRWGGLAAGVGAVGALAAQMGTPGLAGPLAAAAAVLVAAPLVSVRRAAETPWVAAGAAAGERGIIYASARAMDAAARTTAVALCAHGTVTEGQPEVLEIRAVDPEADTHTLLALVAGAEAAAAEHPLAVAIRRHAASRGVSEATMRRVDATAGRGITALAPDGQRLVVGNRRLLLDEGISVAVADDDAARAEARAHSVLFVALGERVRAIIVLQDEVRLGTRAAIQRLFDLGMEVVLVSGDHRGTVETLASQVDVSHVRADLPPEERGGEIRRLREHGGPVAAVGHGDRDEAALAAADVPVVLRGAGSPAGERGVGVASEDLRDAVAALWIARAARTEAWRATVAAVAGGALLVAGATAGWIGPGLAGLLAVGLDAWALPAGSRLLRRIALRVPPLA